MQAVTVYKILKPHFYKSFTIQTSYQGTKGKCKIILALPLFMRVVEINEGRLFFYIVTSETCEVSSSINYWSLIKGELFLSRRLLKGCRRFGQNWCWINSDKNLDQIGLIFQLCYFYHEGEGERLLIYLTSFKQGANIFQSRRLFYIGSYYRFQVTMF